MPATATVAEMVPVVEYLVGRADWEKRRRAIERDLQRQLVEYAGVNVLDEEARVAYFRRQQPCAFLSADKRCQIYPVRPAVCRYHMVVSDPANCAHGAYSQDVLRIDLSALERDVAVEGAKALGELAGGPIALAFVLAARLLGVRLDVDASLVKQVSMVRVELRA